MDIKVKIKVARVLGECEYMLCVFDCTYVCVLPHPHPSIFHPLCPAHLSLPNGGLLPPGGETAESEHIITTLVSNLEPQPSKDDVQSVVCSSSDEELQLQLAEVGEGRGSVGGGGGVRRYEYIYAYCMYMRTYDCVYI